MRHWHRKRLRPVSIALIAALTSLWFAGICVAAQGPCHSPCPHGGDSSHEMTMPCEHAAVSCELQLLDTLTVSAFDFSITPVVLVLLPARLIAAEAAHVPPVDWQATRPPPTPIYLAHLALLN